jgi:hypothetical protein
MSLSWTKQQDFYLRLGFLKALVAAMSSQRRSTTKEAILRRLDLALFTGARGRDALWGRVRSRITWYDAEEDRISSDKPTVAEALLVDGDCPSLLFAVTGPTSYKILDWGHDVGFVGRGNQITERGLLLRHLLVQDRIERFLAGEAEAWNPFVLEPMERLLLLFHLAEIDRVTVDLIERLGETDEDGTLESSNAAQLTCRSMFTVLDQAKGDIQPREIPAYRTARELACTIAAELGLSDLLAHCDGPSRRAPKPVRPSARRSAFAGANRKERRTTKNADHQTIPRFEQLVDLGFLTKPVASKQIEGADLEARRRWKYRATDAARRWRDSVRRYRPEEKKRFAWDGFAASAVAAFVPNAVGSSLGPSEPMTARYLWRAYERIHRAVGHTPMESVALFAMIMAATDGITIEMTAFHRLMLAVKQRSALPEHAFFASGNDLDKMFIQLKPGFLENVTAIQSQLTWGTDAA